MAGSLGLPTNTATDEIRQLIDGKLAEMGHAPQNVQVDNRAETKLTITLINGDGPFHEVDAVLRRATVEELAERLEHLEGC